MVNYTSNEPHNKRSGNGYEKVEKRIANVRFIEKWDDKVWFKLRRKEKENEWSPDTGKIHLYTD